MFVDYWLCGVLCDWVEVLLWLLCLCEEGFFDVVVVEWLWC